MTAQTSTARLQICNNCGGGSPVDVHFCAQCSKILTLGRHGDYFAFFGLPRKLTVEAADLEQRFRSLSRQFHPDYFYNATPAERRASLERSSYLNDAYRTLRNSISRVEYLLGIEGLAPNTSERGGGAPGSGAAASKQDVPAALLEEVFALNEELDEIRELRAGGVAPDVWKARLERAQKPIDAKRAEHEAQLRDLAGRWDTVADRAPDDRERRSVLEALRERVLERSYINNLLAGIERELNS